MLIDRVGELTSDQRVVVAYDKMNLGQALAMQTRFHEAGLHPIAKGNSLVTRPGLDAVVSGFSALDTKFMFDPKHHDTDETMYNYITEDVAAEDANGEPAPPLLVTLHAANGKSALREAVRGRNETIGREADVFNLLGITVLTSLDDDDVVSIFGEGATAESKFVNFAFRAEDAGLQGLVSSGQELVRSYEYVKLDRMIRVIAGIKLPDMSNPVGQKRVYTPDRAISEGAHFVVLGRAVTGAENPVAALEQAVELIDREI